MKNKFFICFISIISILAMNETLTAQDKIGNFTIRDGKLDVLYNSGILSKTQIDNISGVFGSRGISENNAGDLHLRGFWGVVIDKNGGNFGESTSYSNGVNPTGGCFTVRTRISTTSFRTDFIIRNNGNVGIGITDPLETLHVNGNILIPSDKVLKFGTNNTSSGYMTIHNSSNSYNTYIDFLGNLYFRNHEAQGDAKGSALSLQKDGSVIIGNLERYDNSITSTQGNKLMVNGGILCEEVKVISDVPNSDYVFKPDYNLKSLAEVEAFTKENSHLPGVPSAEEFKNNGYKVGEMDDLLLRKVEELTLYIIELNKKIYELERQQDISK